MVDGLTGWVVGFGAMGCGLTALCASISVIYVNGNGNVSANKNEAVTKKIRKDNQRKRQTDKVIGESEKIIFKNLFKPSKASSDQELYPWHTFKKLIQEICTKSCTRFDARSRKFLYKLALARAARNTAAAFCSIGYHLYQKGYKKKTRKKACQVCKFPVHLDLFKFLERLSGLLDLISLILHK